MEEYIRKGGSQAQWERSHQAKRKSPLFLSLPPSFPRYPARKAKKQQDTCRTLTYCKKWEQDIAGLCTTPAGQPAGHSSMVKTGSRKLQDTCRTTCRTLAYRKKWEQDIAGLCWTPAEQPAGHSSIVENGSRTLQDTCRTTCRKLAYRKK